MFGVNPCLTNLYNQAVFPNNPYLKTSSGVQFVNDAESARAYPLMPNSQAILMDKNTSRFYWVEADASGVKSIKTFDFTEVKKATDEKYLTREEFERWKVHHESTVEPKGQSRDVIEVTPIHADNQSESGKGAASGTSRFRTY